MKKPHFLALVLYSTVLLCSQTLSAAPSVTRVSPSTATVGQTTTFTVSGSGLVSGMAFWLDGCSSVSDLGGSSSSRKWSCKPGSAGSKYGLVKNRPSGTTLYNFTVTISLPLPVVSSVTPLTAKWKETVTFTANGSNLTSGMGFWIPNCSNQQDLGGSSSSWKWRCTFDEYGSKSGQVKDKSGGKVLKDFTVSVQGPTVSSVTPATVVLKQNTTFTASGSNLVSGMAFWIGDCANTQDLGGSASSWKWSCTPGAVGSKSGIVKDRSNGNVLRNFTVTVQGPTVSSVTPLTAKWKETVTFTANGSNLTAGMGFWIPNCSNQQDLGGTTSTWKWRCTFDEYGSKAGQVKDAPGGIVLKNFTVAVQGPMVSSVTPVTATFKQNTIFTASGSNLVSGMAFWLDGCANAQDLGGSASSWKWSCTPGAVGSKSGIVKDRPDGIVLRNFTVTVKGPTVSSVTPLTAKWKETVTFTANGSNLTAGMGFWIPNCANQQDLGGTASTWKWSCTFDDYGSKAGVIKDQPNGTVVKDFTVVVAGPVVTSVNPVIASVGQATTFTVNGSNLASGMDFSLAGCDSYTDLSGNSSSWQWSCIPGLAGSKSGSVRAKPGDTNVLKEFTVMVNLPPPVVSSVSPNTATVGQNTTFTVSGANLVSGMAFYLTGCDSYADLSGNSSSWQWSCIPGIAGSKTGLVKAKPGDTNVLKEFTVMVNQPPPPPENLTPGVTAEPGPVTDSKTVTLNWNASIGADLYLVSILDLNTNTLVVNNADATNYPVSITLSEGKKYRWAVSACAGTLCSGYSVRYFQTPMPLSVPTLEFTASPESIEANQSSMLRWTATNADSCTASWRTGTAGIEGAETVWPATTTTYTMTCTGAGGNSPTKSVTVTVAAPPNRAILLLHGMNSNINTWDTLAKELWPSYFDYSPDAPPINLGNCRTIDINGKILPPAWVENDQLQVDTLKNAVCYRLSFGRYDNDYLTGQSGLDGQRCSQSSGCGGDYTPIYDELGYDLGWEVLTAVRSILSELGSNTQIVLIGHSRGGLAARSFLERYESSVNRAERNAVVGLITVGTPNQGSQLGRIYAYLKDYCMCPQGDPNGTHINSSNQCADASDIYTGVEASDIYTGVEASDIYKACEDDWEAMDDLMNTKAISLNLGKPTIDYLSTDSPQIKALNATDSLARLPANLSVVQITYSGQYIGHLYNVVGLGYSAWDIRLVPQGFDQFSTRSRNYALCVINSSLDIDRGCNLDENAAQFNGDGIVPVNMQTIPEPLSNGQIYVDYVRRENGVYHIDEPKQVEDIVEALEKIRAWQ